MGKFMVGLARVLPLCCAVLVFSDLAAAFPVAAPGTEGLEVVVSSTGPVIATYQGQNLATFSNDLYLVVDGNRANDRFLFNNHTSPVGSKVNLGSFPVGTILIFRLHVRNTGRDYFTGPASRNPDNKPHARAQADWMPNETLVSFEDHVDFAYNDLSFSFVPTTTSGCADAYFIGAHGLLEGPDGSGRATSRELLETAYYFLREKPGNARVKVDYLVYPATDPTYLLPLLLVDPVLATALYINDIVAAKDSGVIALNEHVRNTVLRECPNPKIVLVGYSLGAWVIDDWISREENKGLWQYIRAVELYGDPQWYRKGSAYLGGPIDTYGGVARRWGMGIPVDTNPYENNPEGPGGVLSNQWQSRCLQGDAVCGEGYNSDVVSHITQTAAAMYCAGTFCEHKKYALSPDPSNADQVGYGLTERGGKFLALKTFPEMFMTTGPHIAHYETFVEGDFVYIRLYHTGSPTGFGFVGVNGSGWAQQEIPFSGSTTPYWTRVSPHGDRVDYPFNHLCSTAPGNRSDIEAWVYSGTQRSPRVRINLACSAPKEVITPFFDY